MVLWFVICVRVATGNLKTRQSIVQIPGSIQSLLFLFTVSNPTRDVLRDSLVQLFLVIDHVLFLARHFQLEQTKGLGATAHLALSAQLAEGISEKRDNLPVIKTLGLGCDSSAGWHPSPDVPAASLVPILVPLLSCCQSGLCSDLDWSKHSKLAGYSLDGLSVRWVRNWLPGHTRRVPLLRLAACHQGGLPGIDTGPCAGWWVWKPTHYVCWWH